MPDLAKMGQNREGGSSGLGIIGAWKGEAG